MSIYDSAERLVYRVAGLPVALGVLLGAYGSSSDDPLHHAFAQRYWHPDNASELVELATGIAFSPFAFLLASAWYTARNGPITRARYGRGIAMQLADQLNLYFRAGILAPWYYIFSLHDDGKGRASSFIERFETKTCYFRVLKHRGGTPLQDKARFADFCEQHGIRTIATLMQLNGSAPGRSLPDQDLFVKPTRGRGGRGAQRWDLVGPSIFANPAGERLGSADLLARLVEQSKKQPLIIQPRICPHPDLLKLTAGALPTVRILTCLNTKNEPEVMAAMMRTSFGANRTVDNLHAGGLGALVDLESGTLGKASNLGMDSRLGWISAHPDTGAQIEGTPIPCWEEAKMRAIAAHRAFNDRVVVGWDVAIVEDGPIVIEGNGNPDLDILQRFMRIGFREHRLAALLAHHLEERGLARE